MDKQVALALLADSPPGNISAADMRSIVSQVFDTLAALDHRTQGLVTKSATGIYGHVGRRDPGGFTAPDRDGESQFVNAPDDLAALQSLGSLGQTSAWVTGEYVILWDGSEAYWNGSAWVVGRVV